MDKSELKVIEERWNAASAGKWFWDVNPKANQVTLETSLHMIVMDFVRWGMNRASPRFRVNGLMQRCETLSEPIPGREHHSDWERWINHPDAIAIAAAPEDIRSLIAEVRRLREENEKMKTLYENDGKVIERVAKERNRIIHLFRFWVTEYSRFPPDEIILRGDEPRMEDVWEIRDLLKDGF